MDKLYRLRIVTSEMNVFEGLTKADVNEVRRIIKEATLDGEFAQIPCVDENRNPVFLDILAASIQGILHLEYNPQMIARPALAMQ